MNLTVLNKYPTRRFNIDVHRRYIDNFDCCPKEPKVHERFYKQLNDFLKFHAHEESVERRQETYVVLDMEKKACVAYFSISVGQVVFQKCDGDGRLPESHTRTKDIDPLRYPALLFHNLAVDKHYQDQSVGRWIVMGVIQNFVKTCTASVRYVVGEALPYVLPFYRGFESLPYKIHHNGLKERIEEWIEHTINDRKITRKVAQKLISTLRNRSKIMITNKATFKVKGQKGQLSCELIGFVDTDRKIKDLDKLFDDPQILGFNEVPVPFLLDLSALPPVFLEIGPE